MMSKTGQDKDHSVNTSKVIEESATPRSSHLSKYSPSKVHFKNNEMTLSVESDHKIPLAHSRTTKKIRRASFFQKQGEEKIQIEVEEIIASQ